MKLFFKLLLFFLSFQIVQAQDSEEMETNEEIGFRVFLGGSKAFALDDRFVGDAYDLKAGAEIGVQYFITQNWFAGVQVDVLWTGVTNSDRLGGIIKTRIISSSIHGGYMISLSENLELSGKLGLGHGRYAHRASENGRSFHDDAFILYGEPRIAYLFRDGFGIYLGLNFRLDNMRIETSEQFQDYFSRSSRLAPTIGAQFSF